MVKDIKRVAVLFSKLSGYTSACLKSLKTEYGIELLVYRWPAADNAPFNENHFSWIDHDIIKEGQSHKKILATVLDFDPDAIFLGAGWMDHEYLQVARHLKKKGIPVISASDRQWNGEWKQWLGRIISSWYLHSAINVLWVPGDRQRNHAKKYGFSGLNCWSGLYSCDWESFAKIAGSRIDIDADPFFLFVGRYEKMKGIDVLVQGYKKYRLMVSNPWPLVCAGSGSLGQHFDTEDGIVNKGFVQPDDLPSLMRDAGAFVLPSRREPWGVVVHEAATSGIPLICSEVCGAVTHLLQENYNGFLFESENTDHLASAMVSMSELSDVERQKMGVRSHELSKQFTPKQWAKIFVRGSRSIILRRMSRVDGVPSSLHR